MDEKRKVKRKIDDKWTECKFQDLREGDVFVLLEPPEYKQLVGSCLAKGSSYINLETGVWTVSCEMLYPHAEDPDAEFYENQN